MKILFIYNGSEHIGIEFLSSVLKKNGHTTSLLFDPAVFTGHSFLDIPFFKTFTGIDQQIVDKTIGLNPDLICFSCFTGNYNWSIKIADLIKEKCKAPVVFGGVHPTSVPKTVLQNKSVDYIVIGEGEDALLELLKYLGNGDDIRPTIKNLGYKIDDKMYINNPRPYIKNLDLIPLPDKDLFYSKVPMLAEMYRIMTSRGCPFSCSFCCNSMTHRLYCDEKNHVRRRSVDNVLEELRIAKSKYKIKSIIFSDDIFMISYDWLKEFIPLYKREIGIPFSCTTHPNFVKEDILDLLKMGGCWSVQMGIQSGSARVRREIFHRHETTEKILQSALIIKETGIKLFVDIILGAPTETENDIKDSFDLLTKIKPDRLVSFFLTYYPETQIIEIAKNNNVLDSMQYEQIQQGLIGYTHSIGSVSKAKAKLYSTYELLMQLRVLITNDVIYSSLCPFARSLPFKSFISKVIKLLNALKIKNTRYAFYIKYIFAKKDVP
jgi:radical SAM superfamily enzyme YgiQ (UPF0313 family)